MPTSIEKMLVLLVMVPEAIAMITGFLRYRKLERPLQLLLWLVVFGFMTDLLSRILWYYRINNLFLIILYIPVEFALLASIYRYELKGTRMARVIPWLIMLLGAYSLYEILSGRAKGFSPEARFAEGFLILCFVLLYLSHTLRKLSTNHLEYAPMFWLSTGLFIYSACDIIIFIFSNYILSSYSEKFNLQLWDIHAILTIVLYLFYTLALWISPKK